MGTRSHRLISSFINLTVLLGSYYVPSLLGPGDREVKKVGNILDLTEFSLQ